MRNPTVVVIDIDLVGHRAEMVDTAGEDAGPGYNGTSHGALIDRSSC
jgi:hypothetical protein